MPRRPDARYTGPEWTWPEVAGAPCVVRVRVGCGTDKWWSNSDAARTPGDLYAAAVWVQQKFWPQLALEQVYIERWGAESPFPARPAG